jgi:hypothetical protein
VRRVEESVLRSVDDMSPLLDALGIDYRRGSLGLKLQGRCPSPDHTDRGPSWFLNNSPESPHFGTHACSSCGFRGGPAHLARFGGGIADWDQVAALLSDLFLGRAGGVDDLLERTLDRLSTAQETSAAQKIVDFDRLGGVPVVDTPGARYLERRGIGAWDASILGAVWLPEGATFPRPGAEPLDVGARVALPVLSGGAVRTFAARAVDGRIPKYLYPPIPREGLLWGLHLWNPAGRVVGVAEGIITAWGAHRVTRVPCYAVLGSSFTPAHAARLRLASAVVVFQDPGRAGEKMTESVAASLPSVREVRVIDLPADTDAGDALRPVGDRRRLDPAILKEAYDRARDARTPRRAARRVAYGAGRRRMA